MNTGIPIENRYTADETLARRMTNSLFRFSISRPHVMTLLVLLGVVSMLLGVVATIRQPQLLPVGAGLGTLLGALLIAFVLLRTFSMVKRRIAAIAPDGGEYGIGFGDQAMAIIVPLSSAEVSYRVFQEVFPRDGFIYLRHRSSRLYTVLPAELFPGSALDHLRGHLGRG